MNAKQKISLNVNGVDYERDIEPYCRIFFATISISRERTLVANMAFVVRARFF